MKPLLSLDNQEARLRVIALYKAWWRQIPIMLSQMPMPVTQLECQKMLKTQFVKHKDIKDTRIIDVLVVKVSQFSNQLSTRLQCTQIPESWKLNLPSLKTFSQGQNDLKEVVEMWAMPTHVLSKYWKESHREKPKDFLGKFLAGQD